MSQAQNPPKPTALDIARARAEIKQIATTYPDAKVLPAAQMLKRIKALRVLRSEEPS